MRESIRVTCVIGPEAGNDMADGIELADKSDGATWHRSKPRLISDSEEGGKYEVIKNNILYFLKKVVAVHIFEI